VNKDNLLFATIGLLVGFITGYLLHEVMMTRQPARRMAGESVAVTQSSAGSPGAPGAPGSDNAFGPGGGAPADGGGSPGGPGVDPGVNPPFAPAPGASPEAQAAAGVPGAPGAPGAPGMAEVQKLREYVETHPKDAVAVMKLANLNFDIRNWGRARDLYNQYLGLHAADADVLNDLGVCYRQLQDYDHALEQFRHAEKLEPTHWKSVFNEVVVLADLKKFDDADKAFARLKAMAPAQPEVEELKAELQRRRAG
jgi:hypothetical protein